MFNNLFIPKQILKALRVGCAKKIAKLLDDTSDSDVSEHGEQEVRRWGSTIRFAVNKGLKRKTFISDAFQAYEGESASEMAHNISSSDSSSSESDDGQQEAPQRQRRLAMREPSEELSPRSSPARDRSESPNVSTIPKRLVNDGRTLDSPAPGGFQNSTQVEGFGSRKLEQGSIMDFGEMTKARKSLENNKSTTGTQLGCEEEFWFKQFHEYTLIQAGDVTSESPYEDLLDHPPEELEIYLVQCPRDLDPKLLEEMTLEDIVRKGDPPRKLTLPHSESQYETYYEDGRENLNIVRPSTRGSTSSHTLATYKSKGRVIIAEYLDTDPQETSMEKNRKKSVQEKSEDVTNGKSPKKRKRADSSSDWLTSDVNDSLADEGKSSKKKKRKTREHETNENDFKLPLPVDQEPTPVITKKQKKHRVKEEEVIEEAIVSRSEEEATATETTKKSKKKKKKKKHNENELEENVLIIEEEPIELTKKAKKKKKNKHNENELEENVSKIEEEPLGNPCETDSTKKVKKKKKKKKHHEEGVEEVTVPSTVECPLDEPSELDIAKHKKKKKKSNDTELLT